MSQTLKKNRPFWYGSYIFSKEKSAVRVVMFRGLTRNITYTIELRFPQILFHR